MSYHYLSGTVIFKSKKVMKAFLEELVNLDRLNDDYYLRIEGENYSSSPVLNEESMLLDIPADLYRGVYEDLEDAFNSLSPSMKSKVDFSGTKLNFYESYLEKIENFICTPMDFKNSVKRALNTKSDKVFNKFLDNAGSSKQFDIALRII